MKEEIDKDDLVKFIDFMFNLNDKEATRLISEELINLYDASKKDNPRKIDSIDDCLELYLSLLIKFNRVSIDKMTATSSIDELLNIFYEINYSYLREDESKDFIDIITSNPEKKIIYKESSFSDMEYLINLIEYLAYPIISRMTIGIKKIKSNHQGGLVFALYLERMFKIHSSLCALKEIAYVRSKIKDKFDLKLIISIVKIVLHSSNKFIKADNMVMNPAFQDTILSARGEININKRWKPISKLKKEASDLADKLWSEGDKRFHDEMAKHIYETIKQKHVQLIKDTESKYSTSKKFDELSHAEKLKKIKMLAEKSLIGTIRMAIIPVAEKYNRVWGTKGIKRK